MVHIGPIPEEKFYKCGLYNIGMYLSSFEDIQKGGGSPQKILGVPIRLLRNVNSSKVAIELLKTKERRKALSSLYYDYQGIFVDVNGSLSDGQCMFLKILIDQLIKQEKLNILEIRAIMRRLEFCYTQDVVDRLWDYSCMRRQLKVLGIEIPSVLEGGEYTDYMNDKLKCIIRYKKEEHSINQKLEEIRAENLQYEYRNRKYKVRFPYSVNDILTTGELLSNCLYTYVDKLCERKTTVMFVIEQKRNIPVAALEININNKNIFTALGENNSIVEEEVENFLEEFAKERKFDTSYYIDWDDGMMEDDFDVEELLVI